MQKSSRRRFVGEVGFGMLAASIGASVVMDMGLAEMPNLDQDRLDFGDLESLVVCMQETPLEQLLPTLLDHQQKGVSLKTLVAAGALANARTFGGEDYIGFHTMMALAPAFRMSKELSGVSQSLPVLKVLYRNTQRIHEFGGREKEVLRHIACQASEQTAADTVALQDQLRKAVRERDLMRAEAHYAELNGGAQSAENLLDAALFCVEDETEVHRVALPYRAWDLLDIVGMEHAHTMLRQSIRYCVRSGYMTHDSGRASPSTLLPKLFDSYKLEKPHVVRETVDASWVRQFAQQIFSGTADQAAEATAAAIADGIDAPWIGRAITLAANQLVLRDRGRTPREESPGKPVGSVHGDSIGVHATDSANAWRNLSMHSNGRNQKACLILGAYQVAYDRVSRGGDFLNWDPLPVNYQYERVQESEPVKLIELLNDAIKNNMQAQAAAVTAKYGALGHDSKEVFDCLLQYAVSEDGALHAEKYYRTIREEFSTAADEHRWEFATSLARVTASEFGRTAAGYQQATELLKQS